MSDALPVLTGGGPDPLADVDLSVPEDDPGLTALDDTSRELIDAVEAKDPNRVTAALREAFAALAAEG